MRSRAQILETIPARYRPSRHLGLTVGSGLAVLVLAAIAIDDLRALELLVVPVMLVLSNAGEWTAHRYLLHHRVRPFHVLYDQHTPRHHAAYRYDDMAIESWRELRLVLIPGFGVALISLSVSPLALAAGLLITPNAGWLVLASSSLYVVAYELSHLSYHLKKDHPVSRLRLVKWLREHHRRHHDPRLMQRWNFNVTVPLFDRIMGTHLDERRFRELTGLGSPEDTGPLRASTRSHG
jgi:hypothetical protein